MVAIAVIELSGSSTSRKAPREPSEAVHVTIIGKQFKVYGFILVRNRQNRRNSIRAISRAAAVAKVCQFTPVRSGQNRGRIASALSLGLQLLQSFTQFTPVRVGKV
ncbi:hypothetical protein JTB14_033298 [Gonioctena quinquepunctata]|nr:hypothetical protein JTB14_033298 [Gonioctena quinquepunctata]